LCGTISENIEDLIAANSQKSLEMREPNLELDSQLSSLR
jgi:hypothetical protein